MNYNFAGAKGDPGSEAGKTAGGGFTLMEVCVAIAVLAAGIVVFGRYLDGFNRIRALEREQARTVLETARAVEHFVQNPPACRDTTFAFGALAASNQTSAARNQTLAAGSSKPAAVQVTLKTIPGPRPIAWLQASPLACTPDSNLSCLPASKAPCAPDCVVTPCPRTTSKAPVFRRLVRCVKD